MNTLDSIDEPIRNLIININRIGLQTKFSCCGFDYENQSSIKNHNPYPYILFYDPDPENVNEVKTFLLFTSTASGYGWTIDKWSNGWTINYNKHNRLNLRDPAGNKNGIDLLNKFIENEKSFFKLDKFWIKDGYQQLENWEFYL